jgi:hypothetical protein
MWKLVMGIYMTIGFVLVLMATEGFSRDSESALMGASVGVLIALAGTGGSLIKRRRFWWSFLFASIFATATFIGMFAFFETIWRSL